jgi:hypothetical protein
LRIDEPDIEWRVSMHRRPALLSSVLLIIAVSASTPALRGEAHWILTAFGGQMTDNAWEEALNPAETDFIDSYLVGLAVGRDFASRGAWHFGWESQVVSHFGEQDHFELNLPFYARYQTSATWKFFKSFTFGLGLSYASEVPQTEINRDGESASTMLYWMGEIEFHLPSETTTLVFRLHHRSDGYGVIDVDSGSNALVLGLRRKF